MLSAFTTVCWGHNVGGRQHDALVEDCWRHKAADMRVCDVVHVEVLVEVELDFGILVETVHEAVDGAASGYIALKLIASNLVR